MCAKAARGGEGTSPSKYGKELLAGFYRTMTTIRHFEQTVEKCFLEGEVPGFVHLYIGEEAVAAGVMANLRDSDYIQSTHRGHGHAIAKGADLKRMMAEIFGKSTGSCKGKGGSMHIADFGVGMLGANGVVGGGFTIATGAALAHKMQGTDGVAVAFAGNFTDVPPTAAQISSGARVVAWLLQELKLTADVVVGRSELENVGSPGRQWLMGARWKEILLQAMQQL